MLDKSTHKYTHAHYAFVRVPIICSLLTLSRVLVKLGKKDAGHINYRDSKLTRILKPSLAGNARMGAICCISPAVQYSDESKSTLDFASRTMLVTTNAKTNEMVEYDDALVGEFEKEIDRFKTETAHAEESRRKLAESLREAEDQIVCLMANVELEKSKSSRYVCMSIVSIVLSSCFYIFTIGSFTQR